MKWCNKSKEERRSTWFTAPAPVFNREAVDTAKQWCKAYDSPGRFYYHYTNTRWWFELEEDAIMFALSIT